MENETSSSSSNVKSYLSIKPPIRGDLIAILSIDGGGIRGIISAVILAYLESQLQVIILFQMTYSYTVYTNC